MAATQEYLVTCGTGKIPGRLPVDRTRVIPAPPLYHGAHPIILYGRGLYALSHLGGVFAAGVPPEHAEVARRVGFEPFPTVEAALGEAEARLGRQCTISYHPHLAERSYYTRVHVNGAAGGGDAESG